MRTLWNSPFSSKPTDLLVLFVYIILHWIGSLDFISVSVWHSSQIYNIGCCTGGQKSFWVSAVSASAAPRSVPSPPFLLFKPKGIAFLFKWFLKFISLFCLSALSGRVCLTTRCIWLHFARSPNVSHGKHIVNSYRVWKSDISKAQVYPSEHLHFATDCKSREFPKVSQSWQFAI